MKKSYIILAYLLAISPLAHGDGYPFDADTQEIEGNSLKIEIDKSQAATISSTGIAIFTAEQLTLIHRFYPSALAEQRVITATFNDNIEEINSDDVYCFWIRPYHIAITLNSAVINDLEKSNRSLAHFTEAPGLKKNLFRMSPEGIIYHLGKAITLEEALNLITEYKNEANNPNAFINVVFPPPFFPARINEENYNFNTKVTNLFLALERHANANGILISKTW